MWTLSNYFVSSVQVFTFSRHFRDLEFFAETEIAHSFAGPVGGCFSENFEFYVGLGAHVVFPNEF